MKVETRGYVPLTVDLGNGIVVLLTAQSGGNARIDIRNDGNRRINIQNINMTASTIGMSVRNED